MSKKIKKPQFNKKPEKEQEISSVDDPYWKVSGIFKDPRRMGRYIQKFEDFDEDYPLWVGELMEGTPTLYCVLGVTKGASEEEIENAYERKMKLSSYENEVIMEAFEVLSDPELQKEYDKLLLVFRQITKCLPPVNKVELIENHSANIQTEKEYSRMNQLFTTYKGFIELFPYGIPDLYDVIGLTKRSTIKQIKRKCRSGSKLFNKIYTILGNHSSREDYDFINYFFIKYINEGIFESRDHYKEKWDNMDSDLYEKMIFNALTDPDEIKQSIRRFSEIMNQNQDWKQYLPPNKKTFFSILGLDHSMLSGDKKEIEKVIREKYRFLEKTPQVNLAYSMLKNASQREDYLWIIENSEILKVYGDLFLSAIDHTEIYSGVMQDHEIKEGSQSEEKYTQMTFDDIMEMVEKIVGNETN